MSCVIEDIPLFSSLSTLTGLEFWDITSLVKVEVGSFQFETFYFHTYGRI